MADGSRGSPRKAKSDPFSSVPEGSGAVTDMVAFQNYAGLRGQSRDPHPYPLFLKNSKQSTCGFIFAFFCMVGGSLSSPVIRHSFVSGGPTARSRAGPGGAFLPRRPPFQRYTSPIPALLRLVSTVGVLVAATEVRAVSIVRQCLGQLSMHSPHTTQTYGSIDHVPAFAIDRECARRAATRAHAAADAHVHVVDDVPAQALGRPSASPADSTPLPAA